MSARISVPAYKRKRSRRRSFWQWLRDVINDTDWWDCLIGVVFVVLVGGFFFYCGTQVGR